MDADVCSDEVTLADKKFKDDAECDVEDTTAQLADS